MASGLTPRASVPYPVNTDGAAVATDIQAVANVIDAKIPLFFQQATVPSVTSAMTGTIWWCTNPSISVPSGQNYGYGFNYWDGTSWYNVTEQMFMVGTMAPSPTFQGLIWYNPSTYRLSYWNATTSSWVDMIPASSSSSGQVWVAGAGSSGEPGWVTPGSGALSSSTNPAFVPPTTSSNNGQYLGVVAGVPTFSALNVPTNAALTATLENMSISSLGATGAITLSASVSAFYYYTGNATGSFSLNLTSTAGLNSTLSTNQAITFVFLNTNGSTAYTVGNVSVDGTNQSVIWQGGTAPTGNASAVDAYTLTVIKTGSATYKVLGSLTKFA